LGSGEGCDLKSGGLYYILVEFPIFLFICAWACDNQYSYRSCGAENSGRAARVHFCVLQTFTITADATTLLLGTELQKTLLSRGVRDFNYRSAAV